MSEHTPGPWIPRHTLKAPQDVDRWCVVHYQDNQDCVVCDLSNRDSQANARLIAASPSLLAALEAITPPSCQSQGIGSPNYDNGLRCDEQGRPQEQWCTACRARSAIKEALGAGS